MKKRVALMLTLTTGNLLAAPAVTYPIVDTGQSRCYDDRSAIRFPQENEAFFGQDAEYRINPPAYKDNGDGTISDQVTGLMWQADPGEKITWQEAMAGASKCRTGGYTDWRMPTIKELYSLINFDGLDPDPRDSNTSGLTPFIDTRFFNFHYGKAEDGDRVIDSQWATSTLYKSKVMHGERAMFGVNFADGRIKGYPVDAVHGRGAKKFYVIYVRGNEAYGKNAFRENGDGTITDQATGLMWMQADSGKGMDWKEALKFAESMKFAGYSDWRLPTAKELESIVDYSRCPDVTGSAAIDPLFHCTEIINEKGQQDYAHYWSSTTHLTPREGNRAAYIAFGRALGFMHGDWMDVHGAGCQRSDQKTGDESDLPEQGHGPQGDAQRINNLVRLVRGGDITFVSTGPALQPKDTHPKKQASGAAEFMRREDRNGDGKVSRSEFRGPSEHFDHFDTDNNGYITEDEAPTGPPPGGLDRSGIPDS